MSTKRITVANQSVNYYDGQQITYDELTDDQSRHISSDAANVANLSGSGIVKRDPIPNILFNSDDLNSAQQTMLDGYMFDGQNVYTGSSLNSVSDSVEGVQLAIELTNVPLKGKATTKVVIIGDNYNNELIHDDLVFNDNGLKITQGRYKSIRAIIFNDFAGNNNGSYSHALDDDGSFVGGCIIREAGDYEVSADSVIISQKQEPSLFWSEFKTYASYITVNYLLTDAVGSDKSVDDLDIGIYSVSQRSLTASDVTTRIGQKFLLTGNNIQKVSILLSVDYDDTAASGHEYDWSGDVILNIHALQTSVSCIADVSPDNAIDFDPNPSLVGQFVLNSEDLENQGVILDGYAQQVDFVLTGSKLSDPVRSGLVDGNYYVITIGRSGDADTGTLLLEESTNRIENGYMVVYDGSSWVNVTESDMWFSIEGDFIKVSDGILYEDGVGLEILKIKEDETNTQVPYIEGDIPFYTSAYDGYNYVLVESSEEFSDQEQDQRTGNFVYSRVTPVPEVSLISETNFTTLITVDSNPAVLAKVRDHNPRGNPSFTSGNSSYIGLIKNDEVNIISPGADLLSFNWEGSIIYPNAASQNKYRVTAVNTYNDQFGDVNGDGDINSDDVDIISNWLSKWGGSLTPVNRMQLADAYVQQLVADGYLDTLEFLRADVNGDGYVDAADQSLISSYISGAVATFSGGSTFSRMNIQVENLTDPLTTSVTMWANDSNLISVPYSTLGWTIKYFPTWNPESLLVIDTRGFITTSFVDDATITAPSGNSNLYSPGDIFIDGQLKRTNGNYYPVDFEMNHLSLEMPYSDSYGDRLDLDGYTNGILLFDSFVAESSDGKTAAGFDAMKYSDGTFVQIGDFSDGKVKITASLQSVMSNQVIDQDWVTAFFNYVGNMSPANFDILVAATLTSVNFGLYYDPTTSLLQIRMDSVTQDGYGNSIKSDDVRILITVFLKKAGFENETREITGAQMKTLLGV